MEPAILVLNAGSSSIKFRLFAAGSRHVEARIHGQIEGIHTAPHFVARSAHGEVVAEQWWDAGTDLRHEGAVAFLGDAIRSHAPGMELVAVGHRVVHGGPGFAAPEMVDSRVFRELTRLIPLAPLHQPHNLAPIRMLFERRPGLPQVACFDTAFHATNPDVACRFAIPGDLHDAGVRRYGFHGLSYEYIASVLPRHDAHAAAARTIVCHLGNGSSLCAMQAGKSIATTMGFTALDGLPMGTRSGAIDPGVLLYLMDEKKLDSGGIAKLLYERSGLLGVSGMSSDMRTLQDSHDPRAQLAVNLFVYRIRRELGSLVAALGGLDALVFTAGIGENSRIVRERVCRDAAWLGLDLDVGSNTNGGPRISSDRSRVSAWVIPTNEELMIARHTHRLASGRAFAHH